MYCLIEINSKIIALVSCTLNQHFLTSLRYKWHLFNELIGISSRFSLLYLINMIPVFLQGLYHPRICLKSHPFNLCYTYQTPSGKSPFCWDCKGKNLFDLVKLFLIFFLKSFKTLKQTTQQSQSLPQLINVLIPNYPNPSYPSLRSGLQK